ncbi:GNAT family N-acetyltransferase [Carnobacterium inhibens]|uniref:Acetyltransferase n=1 Tax=Carnobacterium inhibens subsp. gilichinskyi TaxID=1266845 RepID=U5SBC1_9LACT|nr:GNAT family protein [Carnobacterium inhibens]AGY81097.1 acetyltransferase [Carnobacterium inhibens subsp. gilichinskyi]
MNKNLNNPKIDICPIKPKNLDFIWKIAYGQKENTWMNWNGPYFNNSVYKKEEFVNKVGKKWMMRVGEKTGMLLEGRIRKVRYWQNQYWDSIKYGVLREEWHVLTSKNHK